uniref:Uncharacterized protein n=1 Tax=Vespula pensylvanica TaxID=30213 RepID=A0A834K694_VESPE|nr:hypothetical protein H0235_015663 [Vespula pensylvanica]
MEFEKRVQRSTAGWSRKPQGKARGPTIGKQRCWWSALAGRKNGDAKVPFEDCYFPRSHGCHTSSAILRLSLHCDRTIENFAIVGVIIQKDEETGERDNRSMIPADVLKFPGRNGYPVRGEPMEPTVSPLYTRH